MIWIIVSIQDVRSFCVDLCFRSTETSCWRIVLARVGLHPRTGIDGIQWRRFQRERLGGLKFNPWLFESWGRIVSAYPDLSRIAYILINFRKIGKYGVGFRSVFNVISAVPFVRNGLTLVIISWQTHLKFFRTIFWRFLTLWVIVEGK